MKRTFLWNSPSSSKIFFAPKYVDGLGNTYMKFSGKRSAFFMLSTESGSMKQLAKGVAVKPTYVAFLNNAQICLILALVFVGLVSSLFVFNEALSASSSISNNGQSMYPLEES